MTYSLQQMQNTIRYIVNQCTDDTERALSGSQKRWLEREIMVALEPLEKKNKKLIVVNPTNLALEGFFASLVAQRINFPSDTTYLIYRRGDSYEKTHGDKTEIYSKVRVKSKHASRRVSELQEQLEAMHFSYEEDKYSNRDSDEENDLFEVPPTYTPGRASVPGNRRDAKATMQLRSDSETIKNGVKSKALL